MDQRRGSVNLPKIQEERSEELRSTQSFRPEDNDPPPALPASRQPDEIETTPQRPRSLSDIKTDIESPKVQKPKSAIFQRPRQMGSFRLDLDTSDHRVERDAEAESSEIRRSSSAVSASPRVSKSLFPRLLSFHRSSSLTDDPRKFASNLTRKSQNLRNSLARHSTALTRFTNRTGSLEGDALGSGSNLRSSSGYRYAIGDPVLINNHHSRWAKCVNRLGFPPEEGSTAEEQSGPYTYVLGNVKIVHYEENAVFYTVTRADTGVEVRGDPDFMEPLLTEAGIKAATKAAKDYAMGSSMDDVSEDDDQSQTNQGKSAALTFIRQIAEIVFLPFFLIYDIFVFAIGARLFHWAELVFQFTRRQAHAFLNGSKPYECSTTITTVNIIVLCSIWYMFIDQARLAFFPADSDDTLALINFIIWCILSVELLFEVFIRPDDYYELIHSDKAYTPLTVRFISGLHLAVELVSLAFFIPEFVCLFQSEITCDDRPKFSFLHATLLAVSGSTRREAFLGRCFHACVRLRVFALVRHWRNMWINSKFLKRDRQKQLELEGKRKTNVVAWNRLQQKQRDAALINASNIGTALMVTNSYRALTILCTILGLFPMITLIYFGGVTNSIANNMIAQLQGVNELVTVANETNCAFLVESVDSWTRALYHRDHSLITAQKDEFLLALAIQPARCIDTFEAVSVEDFSFQKRPCEELAAYGLDVGTGDCILGLLDGTLGNNLQEIAKNFGIRVGNIETKYSESSLHEFVLDDGTSLETTYQVAAHMNQTYAVESSALASFLLQVCLLITVLCGLVLLRHDAEDLVLRPLRSMLKIVARYAKNPLAQAASSSKDTQSVLTDESESEASSHASDGESSEGEGFGTYETEQLITAVAKITDLLRKCWGVAGADIISTNLASREGELAEVFNPTVPGKAVYALFAFAAINGFDHALKCLGGDVMILINDVASVLHGEVYRWGFGDSGQCNKNLGATFLMVFRIGLVKEVKQKLEEATNVIFKSSDTKNSAIKRRLRDNNENKSSPWTRTVRTRSRGLKGKNKAANNENNAMADIMKLSLQSLPGIATFTDRAVIGMLKSFAGIHRDNKLRAWSRDFRLSAGVGAFEVNMIFGMDAGWAVEGAVGSEYKIDATYLSPHVNMASRMMSACKHYGVTILLSEAVQELMSESAKKKLRNVDRVTVKGSVRVQKIFTYDARHKGADFFLFSRSDDVADNDAESYKPAIWDTDQDLQAMRHHVTDDFEAEFKEGMKAYYSGDWKLAIEKLESANEIMVDAAMEEGYLHDEMDNSPDRKELYRNETADGPSSYLVHYMNSKGGVAPDEWAGWHPLLSK